MATSSATSEERGLASLSQSDLIARITHLQLQLESQTAQITTLTAANQDRLHIPRSLVSDSNPRKAKKTPKPFDISRYNTRHIALKFSYLGHRYNGYEHATGSFTPLPTIEEVLWKALRKARLISPSIAAGVDDSYDVVFDSRDREQKYYEPGRDDRKGRLKLELNWEGCQYSKCGRTDRGVSAFGQVVGIRVRSNRPKSESRKQTVRDIGASESGLQSELAADGTGSEDHQDYREDSDEFDPVKDELPYIQMINNVLPPDIRVLAWCPNPPEDFDARFSCRERRYKYFFTNPAFCPTPGPQGLTNADGKSALIRQGWLDIEKMKIAAKKLEGLHDFRNLCKIDASKQMPSCERRITFADVEEADTSLSEFVDVKDLNASGRGMSIQDVLRNTGIRNHEGPKVYTFSVHGTAFLWHQVRCMVAVLFLVGQGLERPEIIDELLDIKRNPARPNYEMADDAPLVLWDCVFPSVDSSGVDGLEWIHSGDEASISSITAKTDGKFGLGGIVEDLWTEWQEAKVRESQLAALLGLTLRQGDGSALSRGGHRDPSAVVPRSQKVFNGSSKPRLAGQCVPVMQKPKLDTLEVQNAKYLAGKGARRDEKKNGAQNSD